MLGLFAPSARKSPESSIICGGSIRPLSAYLSNVVTHGPARSVTQVCHYPQVELGVAADFTNLWFNTKRPMGTRQGKRSNTHEAGGSIEESQLMS